MLANQVSLPTVAFDGPPWRLSGTVYGALLNHAPQLAALGGSLVVLSPPGGGTIVRGDLPIVSQ